jgi:hypothetical protein
MSPEIIVIIRISISVASAALIWFLISPGKKPPSSFNQGRIWAAWASTPFVLFTMLNLLRTREIEYLWGGILLIGFFGILAFGARYLSGKLRKFDKTN